LLLFFSPTSGLCGAIPTIGSTSSSFWIKELLFPSTVISWSFFKASYQGGGNAQRKAAGLGKVVYQVGGRIARSLAQAQFRAKMVTKKATETEHLASFDALWNGLWESGW
jgi:hypothetical protein